MYFEGSVKGLNLGAPVEFKGVKIGAVTGINLEFLIKDQIFRTEVTIEVIERSMQVIGDEEEFMRSIAGYDSTKEEQRSTFVELLIKKGLRAQLVLQSMVTGQLLVMFDFFPNEPANLVGVDTEFIEVPTIPQTMERLQNTVENLLSEGLGENLQNAIKGLDELVNSKDLRSAVKNVDQSLAEIKSIVTQIDDSYAPLNESVQAVVERLESLVIKIEEQIDPVSKDLSGLLQETRHLVTSIDEQVKPVAGSIDETLKDTRGLVRNVNERIEPIATHLDEALIAARNALESAGQTLTSMQGMVPDDSALIYEITKTFKRLSDAVDSIQSLASYLERHPESLLKGKSGN